MKKNSIVQSIRQCKQIRNLIVEFNNKLDAFQECTALSIPECMTVLNEIGDTETIELIQSTIARFSEEEEDAEEDTDHHHRYQVTSEPVIEKAVTSQVSVVSDEEVEVKSDETDASQTVVSDDEVEVNVEETTAPQAEESSLRPGYITPTGYPGTVFVDNEGNIFVDNKKITPYHTPYGVMVNLPTGGGEYRVLQHSLVAMAYLKPKPRENDRIVHKNGNVFDCRPRNLGWQSETKTERPRIDAGDARDISEALIACHFDEAATAKMLAEHHKRATIYAIRKISNKEIFTEVSDKYFDAKHHVVLEDTKVTSETTHEDTISRDRKIYEELKAHRWSIRDTYLDLRSKMAGLTIYEVFNAKDLADKLTESDVKVVIRYTKDLGVDIKETIQRECKLTLTEDQIRKATRKQRM